MYRRAVLIVSLKEANRLWGQVTQLNPVQPSWWYALGDWPAPQIYVTPGFADLRVGRDAAVEAVLSAPVR
jgi:hypothetical protein